MADNKNKVNEYYTKPPELGRWEGFRLFMWNSETSQFMGRTGSSWAKILVFYLIFYAVLVALFVALMAVFYQTLDMKRPKWELDSSLIGSNPGLGFRPMPPPSNVESTLIWYRSSDKGNVKYWQEQLRVFVQSYQKENNPYEANVHDCENQAPLPEGKVCEIQMPPGKWNPCLPEYGFGFGDEKGGPCIFLKLNKIYNWHPEYYNETNLVGVEKMNDYLRKDIIDAQARNENKMVWVTCEGENPADKENIGPLRYIPNRGFTSHFFPFKNQDGYMSPLVAVHFEQPKRGILINIECKAWAKNIIHDRIDRRGSVHFELMVD